MMSCVAYDTTTPTRFTVDGYSITFVRLIERQRIFIHSYIVVVFCFLVPTLLLLLVITVRRRLFTVVVQLFFWLLLISMNYHCSLLLLVLLLFYCIDKHCFFSNFVCNNPKYDTVTKIVP